MDLNLLVVSNHALERYRERVNHNGTREDVIEQVQAGEEAPTWVRKYSGSTYCNDLTVCFVLHDSTVFILAPAENDRHKATPIVVSVMPLKWCWNNKHGQNGQAKKFNKKLRKEARRK
jgi:hypothetical protein